MFGDRISYSSTSQKQTSEDYNGEVDAAVKKILDVSKKVQTNNNIQESFERVKSLLKAKDLELRRLSKALYEHDTLDADEMDRVIRGKGLDKDKEKNKVRTWDVETNGNTVI